MRVAVVQTNPVFGDIRNNVKDTLAMMEGVNADLFVLPELCTSGYNFVSRLEVEQLSESIDGFTFQHMAEFSKKHCCYLVYGFPERTHEGKLYNSSVLVGPAGLVGLYRKIHLYYRETLFFEPGNLGFPVFDIPFGKIGMMICFDWFYPESARSLALNGAQLIAHPANLVLPYCPDAMVTRCLENRVFAVTANRLGSENRGGIDLTYIGKSEIVTPKGEILVRLDENKPAIAVQDIDLDAAKDKQINEFNNLFADRKPKFYALS